MTYSECTCGCRSIVEKSSNPFFIEGIGTIEDGLINEDRLQEWKVERERREKEEV